MYLYIYIITPHINYTRARHQPRGASGRLPNDMNSRNIKPSKPACCSTSSSCETRGAWLIRSRDLLKRYWQEEFFKTKTHQQTEKMLVIF